MQPSQELLLNIIKQFISLSYSNSGKKTQYFIVVLDQHCATFLSYRVPSRT